jgi:hypothetical protein
MQLTRKIWHHSVTYRLYVRDMIISCSIFAVFFSLFLWKLIENIILPLADSIIVCGVYGLIALIAIIFFIDPLVRSLNYQQYQVIKATFTRPVSDATSKFSRSLHYVMIVNGERLEGETEPIFQSHKYLFMTPLLNAYLGKDVYLAVNLKKKYPLLLGSLEEIDISK